MLNSLTDSAAVHGHTRQLGHDHLHDLAHPLVPPRAGLEDSGFDGRSNCTRVGRRRQVSLEKRDLALFLVGQIDPVAARNCSAESRRCFTSALTTCSDSASSRTRDFSTSCS